MSILIGPDFVPTKHNVELFNSGNVIALVGKELLEILKGADYQIFNMEVPLTDRISPIDKCGTNLIAPTSTIKGYSRLERILLLLRIIMFWIKVNKAYNLPVIY